MTYFGAGVRDTDIAARVTLLGKLASEEVVELGLEDTVGDELSLLADLARHFWDAARSNAENEHLQSYRLSRMIGWHPAL